MRYLPDFGYRARILTTSAFGRTEREGAGGGVLRAWEPLACYRWLLNGAVRRNKSTAAARRSDPGPASGLVRLLRRWVMIPDGQVTWLPAAAAVGLQHLRSDPAQVIYSTSPPASAHLLGMLLKSLTGLPWVADFRDSWVSDPLDPAVFDVPGRRRLERRMERAVVTAADAVVTATEISAGLLCEFHPEVARKIRVITNGFDPNEESASSVGAGERWQRREGERGGGAAPSSDPGRLDIVHTGSFSLSHPQRGPQPLFAALHSLLREDGSWAGRIRLVLAGRLTVAEIAAASDLCAAGVVDVRGEMGRAACLDLQRRAGALLLLDHRRQGGALSSNVPGKLYEYLAAGRPILALCGEGMVARLVDDLQAGMRAVPDEPEAIRRLLVDAFERFRTGNLSFAVPTERLRRFHRRELARQLADCFDEVVGRVVEGGSQYQGHAS